MTAEPVPRIALCLVLAPLPFACAPATPDHRPWPEIQRFIDFTDSSTPAQVQEMMERG